MVVRFQRHGNEIKNGAHFTSQEAQGRTVQQTRQVRKTRWRSVSGVVWNRFDDLLVLASRSLPRRLAEELEPWDLGSLVPDKDEYLSGFRSERYQVGLEEGFEVAKGMMQDDIEYSVRRDIGGDHQRIHSLRSQYDSPTFKHLLLPIWISAYRYKKRVFRFLVNARNGEVQGERPWSYWKILMAVLAALAAVALIVYLQSAWG